MTLHSDTTEQDGWSRETLAALQHARNEIDCLDLQLLDLLQRRTEEVQRIGQLKTAAAACAQRKEPVVLDNKREKHLLQRLLQHNNQYTRPLAEQHVLTIWNAILSCSRALQAHQETKGLTDSVS